MTDLSQLQPESLRIMLHRAVMEIASIHCMAAELVPVKYMDSIVSAEGVEIVEQSMKLLGLEDLSDASIVGQQCKI